MPASVRSRYSAVSWGVVPEPATYAQVGMFVLAAGLVATRLDGSPLGYNVSELLLPDLVVCHPDRADEVRALLDEAGFEPGGASGASAAESAG